MSGLTRRSRARTVRWVLAVLAVCAVTGGLLGVLWEKISPTQVGVAYQGQVLLIGDVAPHSFDATAHFVLISVAAGVLLGAVVGWLGRRVPTATTGALALGSALCSTLMYSVGRALGPTTPDLSGLKDGTAVPVRLSVSEVGSAATFLPIPDSPLVALTFAALLAVVVLYLVTSVHDSRVTEISEVSPVETDDFASR